MTARRAWPATAERALLRRLEGGCQVPLGALATVTDRMLRLSASVCALDGSAHLTAQATAPASVSDAAALGERVAEDLLARGAGELIARERGALHGGGAMNARLADKAGGGHARGGERRPLSRELKSLGLRVLLWPTVSIGTTDPAPLRAALQAIRTFHWIVFASRNAVAAVLEQLPTPPAGLKVAAVGKATAQV